jgi:hypothetical protein
MPTAAKKVTPTTIYKRIAELCTATDHVEYAGPNLVTIENEKEKTGLYDVAAESFVILQKYDFIIPISTTLFQVHSGDHVGLYSLTAERLVVPVKYELILPTGDETQLLFALYTPDEKVGLFDPERDAVVANAKYDSIQYFAPGWYLVGKGEQYGLFSATDATQTQPVKYDTIVLSDRGTHALVEQKEKVGVFCLQSKVMIVPAKYTHIYEHPDEIIELEHNDTVGLFSLADHETLLETTYSQIVQLTDHLYEVASKNGVGIYCSKTREFLLPPEYEGVTLLQENLARTFASDGTEYIVNLKTGKSIT